MNLLIKDVENVLKRMEILHKEKFYSIYLKKNKNLMFFKSTANPEIVDKKEKLKQNQERVEKKIFDELVIIDQFNIPLIGMKGCFLKKKYYNKETRSFSDIDILVNSCNVYELYRNLKNIGYHIEYKTMYDNPLFNMYVFPQKYMDNTQTLMLVNPQKNISIDIHCNLNITNAHFVKSDTKFDTDVFFRNSIPFENFNNIRVLDIHDDLCVLFRHLLKHHVFYGKTQTGLHTSIQHVLDIAMIINSVNFDADLLLEKAVKYNIIPETIFCLNLYNKIFLSQKSIDLSPYLSVLRQLTLPKWAPILMASLNMKIEDLLIGDFREYFPKLQKAVEKSQSLPNRTLDWIVQALFISLNISRFLK